MRAEYGRLLRQRDFWPLFGAMSLGAFNDNVFRQALISILAFGSLGLSDSDKSVLGSLATGLMILPFLLFSSLAGQLADRYPKSLMVRITKAAELLIMLLAGLFFVLFDWRLLMGALFLMGVQSAFFGPMKYGLLPEVLGEGDLVAGNGLVGGASFILIVLGTMAGSYLANLPWGARLLVPGVLILASALGLFLALRQPGSKQFDKSVKIDPLIWRSSLAVVSAIRPRRDLWLAVLAISWFWAMGSVLLTQLPVVAATSLGGVPEAGTAFVTLLALGVAAGALSAHRLLKGRISASLAPAAALAMAAATLAMSRLIASLPEAPPGSVDLAALFSRPIYLALMASIFLAAAAGGLFVVPLNALLQHKAESAEKARVIAANNLVNALGMVLASVSAAFLMWRGLEISGLFAIISLTALLAALLTAWYLPEAVIKGLARIILRLLYNPKIEGLEHLEKIEGPFLIIPNHTSFADVAMLAAYLPFKPTFAIDSFWAKRWWVRACLKFYDAIPINPTQPIGARGIIEAMAKGATIVIFPEGKLTTNGSVMKLYEGPGLIASHCGRPLVPVIFQDLEYTFFGRARKYFLKPPKRIQVRMTVMEPVSLPVQDGGKESRRHYRRRVTESLYEVMVQAVFKSRAYKQNVYTAILRAAKRFGMGRVCAVDASRKPMTYRGLIRAAKVLGRRLSLISKPGEYVGVLLPNSCAQASVMAALWAGGRIPVMLNYSQGRLAFSSALKAAVIKTVVTSRAFIKAGGLEPLIAGASAEMLYLEDLSLTFSDKIKGLLWRAKPAPSQSPAAVVFTSGSEGRPKGVALSHQNLLSNGWQARSL
ncbi:MAG: MFS transporter, partial [Deltaproteobacteria bacterium]|nr:MFS transporter [Deltaproteobacteria bacterium]